MALVFEGMEAMNLLPGGTGFFFSPRLLLHLGCCGSFTSYLTPTRYRPLNRLGDRLFTNGQTVNLQLVLKQCRIIQQILTLMAGAKEDKVAEAVSKRSFFCLVLPTEERKSPDLWD